MIGQAKQKSFFFEYKSFVVWSIFLHVLGRKNRRTVDLLPSNVFYTRSQTSDSRCRKFVDKVWKRDIKPSALDNINFNQSRHRATSICLDRSCTCVELCVFCECSRCRADGIDFDDCIAVTCWNKKNIIIKGKFFYWNAKGLQYQTFLSLKSKVQSKAFF